MSLIQPTIRRFPKTSDTLADSNLPFSCVITPLREATISHKTTNSSSSNNENNVVQSKKHLELTHHNHPLLTSIPKCQHCGAPHPHRETHYWPHPYALASPGSPSFLVCFLCGGKTPNDRLPPPHTTPGSPNRQGDPDSASSANSPHIFQIPLWTTGPKNATVWSLPAEACPPVCWFLLDGSCTQRSYWTTISHLLLQTLDDIPPHVHIGILLAATVPSTASEEATTTFSYVDLTSTLPHVLQFVQYASEEDEDNNKNQNLSSSSKSNANYNNKGGGVDALLDRMTLVPADSLHLPNIHAAIRSLVDYDPSQLATTQQSYTMSMPLGIAIETILDFMDRAQHPGSAAAAASGSHHANQDESATGLEGKLLYAGGKIMSFVASCPTELRGNDWRPLTRKNLPRATSIGLGGFGGAVQSNFTSSSSVNDDMDSATASTTTTITMTAVDEETGGPMPSQQGGEEMLDTDMTPSSLKEYYRAPKHAEAYFQELGSQCAESALGVDVFVLVQPEHSEVAPEDATELDVGLPFLRCLADRSGAPGPLIFPVHEGYETPIADNPAIQRLQREVTSRVPWFESEDEEDDDNNHQNNGDSSTMGRLFGRDTASGESRSNMERLISNGRHHAMVFGGELRLRLSPSFVVDTTPVDAVDHGPQLAPLYSSGGLMGPGSEEEAGGNLWRLGTCDPFTSVTVDLDLAHKTAQDRLKVEGMGEITWKPVVQTCFAYTTIVKDPDQPGNHLTVRQMRISSIRVSLTSSVESLYSSIDPEVIGAILFHKLTLTLLRDGLSSAQTIGEDWLKSLMVCAYNSAEVQESIQREREEKGLDQTGGTNGEVDQQQLTFYANERLLDREGDLSAEDVLLGQGHELLKHVPLITYALLHCDAIRPSSTSKSSSATSSYFPTLDARCAAGAQMSSMNPHILSKCIAPQLQLWSCDGGLVLDMLDLKLDSIRVAVEEFGMDPKTGKARDDLVLFLDAPDCLVICDARHISRNLPARKKKKQLVIGDDLQRAIDAAFLAYRTPPNVIFDLDTESNKSGEGLLRLLSALVEDQRGNHGAAHFKEWKDNLAAEIHEELDKEE